ncbi:hypothetical protein ACFVXC_31915 [Streptomyces sp. NPDC058257]|uniref:ATP-binding protein n=1 Tax=Streptomyces sp. NPDC058257 TaxID=3346409 RepID=UPI0036EAFA55
MVIKHADARHVAVSVAATGDRLAVEITDDGPTAAVNRAATGEGHGLIGVRERAVAVGGDPEAARQGYFAILLQWV